MTMTATPDSDLYHQATELCLLADMTAKLAAAAEDHISQMATYTQRDENRTHEENHLRALVFALHVQTKEMHKQIEALTDAME
jgi:hypothetical protein